MSVADPQDLLPSDEPLRLLDPDGTFHEHPEHPLDLDDARLRDLYRMMVITRAVDREGINLQRQGQLSVYPSSLGQEAAQVGSAYALAPEDWVFPSYRELGAALVRGVDPSSLLHQFRGTWHAAHDPYEHRYALLSIPIATQMLHATGFAMGAALDGRPLVVMSYFGDGATSEGDAHEAFTFAGTFHAPVVFFAQNNGYAISMPVAKQTAAPTLAHKAVGYGLRGRLVDGNDVLASYVVAREAVERARAGGGATLVEAMTYRMEAHTTSDDATRYRSQAEVDEAARRDPIVRMRAFLRRRDLIDGEIEKLVDEQANDAASAVRAAIYDAPHGDAAELFDHVFVARPANLEAQRLELLATLAADLDADDAHGAQR